MGLYDNQYADIIQYQVPGTWYLVYYKLIIADGVGEKYLLSQVATKKNTCSSVVVV